MVLNAYLADRVHIACVYALSGVGTSRPPRRADQDSSFKYRLSDGEGDLSQIFVYSHSRPVSEIILQNRSHISLLLFYFHFFILSHHSGSFRPWVDSACRLG